MSANAPTPQFDRKTLSQLPTEQLVSLIVQQQQTIERLQQEIERLKVSLQLDSQNSSKPPSSDLLKKPEKQKTSEDKTTEPKRKPGGQPGHPGKTRKGFGRVDRYYILRPQECSHCGSHDFVEQPVGIQRQQVAQLVASPIEVVEYLRHTLSCADCGQTDTAAWPASIVPGQDLSVELQAMHARVGQLRAPLRLSCSKNCCVNSVTLTLASEREQATNARMAEAVEGSVDQLREWVKKQPQVHVDESPRPVLGLKEWLWVSAGQNFCLFHAGDTRKECRTGRAVGGGV